MCQLFQRQSHLMNGVVSTALAQVQRGVVVHGDKRWASTLSCMRGNQGLQSVDQARVQLKLSRFQLYFQCRSC